MNLLGKEKIPFLFIIDFDGQNAFIKKLSDLNDDQVLYQFNSLSNQNSSEVTTPEISRFFPISFEEYQEQFSKIQKEIAFGNTYLLNLTTESLVEMNTDLKSVFYASKASYKIYLKNNFVCFSPESFVKIKGKTISSFPMKGTIDATLPNAEDLILNDEKETAEHYTIVDLIRNDLNLVSKNVRVERFRFTQKIDTAKGKILQVSSEICGDVPENWNEHLGDIFSKLLPAGSITGAPKEKTVEIIRNVESHQRGFYTGVAGIFDGENVDSAVLIRFIEKKGDRYFYKSGGGITASSVAEKEYQEILQKIYIPVSL